MANELFQLHYLRTLPERKLDQGVLVYDEVHVDHVGAAFSIAATDEVGLAIFRKFAAELYEHYRANPNLIEW
jgi:hypothetical protein